VSSQTKTSEQMCVLAHLVHATVTCLCVQLADDRTAQKLKAKSVP